MGRVRLCWVIGMCRVIRMWGGGAGGKGWSGDVGSGESNIDVVEFI